MGQGMLFLYIVQYCCSKPPNGPIDLRYNLQRSDCNPTGADRDRFRDIFLLLLSSNWTSYSISIGQLYSTVPIEVNVLECENVCRALPFRHPGMRTNVIFGNFAI